MIMTNEQLTALLFVLVGFFGGSVMYSNLLPIWLMKKDVTVLSNDGNPGCSNVFKRCGIPMGALYLICDMAKGFLPVYAAARLLGTGSALFALILAAPVLGHGMAPLNHFCGGKCIATSFGALLGLLPKSNVVFILAVVYILFSVVIKIQPHSRRSILSFSIFGILAMIASVYENQPTVGFGCLIIAAMAIHAHVRRQTVGDTAPGQMLFHGASFPGSRKCTQREDEQ